jgi:hypothetical protein
LSFSWEYDIDIDMGIVDETDEMNLIDVMVCHPYGNIERMEIEWVMMMETMILIRMMW